VGGVRSWPDPTAQSSSDGLRKGKAPELSRGSRDYLSIHGFIGYKNLLNIKKYCQNKIGLFMVTEFTSDRGMILLPYEDFARIALELEFFGVQAPATKPEVIKRVRDIVGKSMIIISCGIGVQGAPLGSAIEVGSDFEVIGRTIYKSKSPRVITKKIAKVIRGVIE